MGRSQAPGAPPAAAGELLGDPRLARAAVAESYRERARLGLGSPFRLIDFAMHDPRLDERARLRVARSVFRTARRGEGYRIDPVVLNRVFNLHAGPRSRDGARHLRLIDEAVARAEDPRAGELAVRLAYRLAVLEGTIDPVAFARAVEVAALLRDRESARRDARRLAASARARRTDPVLLVAEWRRGRRFEVEAPPLLPLPPASVREAVRAAPALLAALREVGADARPAPAAAPPPRLSLSSARALAAVARATPMPPQAAVAVRVRHADRGFRARSPGAARAWATFAEEARTEDGLVAQRSILLARAPGLRAVVARVSVLAALDLRTFAQERPWFPGFGGPGRKELYRRRGVRVVLDPALPAAWAPYYRRAVDGALAELGRVLPRLDVRGLTVRVGREAGSDWALARYDPGGRVITWPADTGPGTLAHEVAHDLDRQAAVRRYGVRGRYASDRAARSSGDPLAPALETLAESSRGISARSHPHALRPAEVFARNLDWYVTTSLARRGISNGHLSSAQDHVLTGHGTVRPPASPESYGPALRKVVRALVSPGAEPGPEWRSTPGAVVRTLADAGGEWGTASAFHPGFARLRSTRDSAAAALGRWLCASPRPFTDWPLFTAHRDLLFLASAARARRLAVQAAARSGGPEAVRDLLHALDGGPSPSPAAQDWVGSLAADVLSFHAPGFDDPGRSAAWLLPARSWDLTGTLALPGLTGGLRERGVSRFAPPSPAC